MGLLRGFAGKFQQVSVDEAYLLPGPENRGFEEVEEVGIWMKLYTYWRVLWRNQGV